MYRVYSCSGNSKNDIIGKAMLQAFDDGNKIITASLGLASGWGQQFLAVIAERIASKGVIWYV